MLPIITLLQKLFIPVFICQTLTEAKDILYLFKPKPDLPEPLNDFLTSVQKHKHDFAAIRDYAKKQRKYDTSLLDTHRLFLENVDDNLNKLPPKPRKYKRSLLKDLQEVPKNSIYPYMYQNQHSKIKTVSENHNKNKKALVEHDINSKNKQTYTKNRFSNHRKSKNIHSPIRLGRELDKHNKKFGYKTDTGGNKNQRENLNKRNVEISIRSDGKLVKNFNEDKQNSKSIVLKIEPDKTTEPEPFVQQNQVANLNFYPENNKILNKNVDQTHFSKNNEKMYEVEDQTKFLKHAPNNDKKFYNNKNIGIPLYKDLYGMVNEKNQNLGNNTDINTNLILSANKKSYNFYHKNFQPESENNNLVEASNSAHNNLYEDRDINKVVKNVLDKNNKNNFEFEKVKGFMLEENKKWAKKYDDQNHSNSNQINANHFGFNKRNIVENGILDKDPENYVSIKLESTVFDYALLEVTEQPQHSVIYNPPLNINAKSKDNPALINEQNFQKYQENQSFKVIEQVTRLINIIPDIIEEKIDNIDQISQGDVSESYTPADTEIEINQETYNDQHKNNTEVNINTEKYTQKDLDHFTVITYDKNQSNCINDQNININLYEENLDCEQFEKEKLGVSHQNIQEGETSVSKNSNNSDVEEIEVIELGPTKEENKIKESGNEEIIQKQFSENLSLDDKEVIKNKKAKNKKTYIIHRKMPVPQMSLTHEQKTLIEEPYHYKYLQASGQKKTNNEKMTQEEMLQQEIYDQNITNKIENKNIDKNQETEYDDGSRNKKHSFLPKWKRKRVRQHPKKRIFIKNQANDHNIKVPKFHKINIIHEKDKDIALIQSNNDPNNIINKDNKNENKRAINNFPNNNQDFIPAFQSRKIKAIDAVESDYDPYLSGFDSKELPDELQEIQKNRKKVKSEGEYADEEDPVSETKKAKYTMVKKIENQFGVSPVVETEDNDDEYNYPLETKPQVKHINKNNLKIVEHKNFVKAPHKSNKNHHQKSVYNVESVDTKNYDKLQNQEDFIKQLQVKKQPNKQNVDKEFLQASKKIFKENLEDIQNEEVASIHRGHAKSKKIRKITANPSAPLVKNKINIPSVPNYVQQPISIEENQNLFLKYNPDFQRWPQFVRENDRYQEKSKIKSQQNRQPLLQNEKIAQMSKNSYFVGPGGFYSEEKKFVKRNNNDNKQEIKPIPNNNNKKNLATRNSNTRKQNEQLNDKINMKDQLQQQKFQNPEVKANLEINTSLGSSVEVVVTELTVTEAIKEETENTQEYSSVDHSVTKNEITTMIVDAVNTMPSKDFEKSEDTQHADSSIDNTLLENGADVNNVLKQAGVNSDILDTGRKDVENNISISLNIDPNNQNPNFYTIGGNLEDVAANKIASENSTIGQNETAKSSTFAFPEGGEDEGNACQSQHPELDAHITVCDDDKAINITMTTMLALVNETHNLYKDNITKEQYLDLNDVLRGDLPKSIVLDIWGDARGSIRRGLRGEHLNMNLELSNSSDTAVESRFIIQEMSHLMTRLQHATSCQQLPGNLKSYLVALTRNSKEDVLAKLREMNDIEFDDHQGLYVFHSSSSDNLSSKVAVLKDLLNKYNNLPPDCKERAEPVKEYIENHLGLLTNMLTNSKSSSSPKGLKHKKSLKDPKENFNEEKNSFDDNKESFEEKPHNEQHSDDQLKQELIQKQLEEIGLGDKPNFSPNFDLDELIENRKTKNEKENTKNVIESTAGKNRKAAKNHKRGSKSHVGVKREAADRTTSSQYGKLAESLRQQRHKRQSAERINNFFGKPNSNRESRLSESEDMVGFESPMVLNF